MSMLDRWALILTLLFVVSLFGTFFALIISHPGLLLSGSVLSVLALLFLARLDHLSRRLPGAEGRDRFQARRPHAGRSG